MSTLRLAIPQQTPNPGIANYLNPARLKSWLEGLPLGNPTKTGEELLKALQLTNRADAAFSARYNFLDQCRPIIADLLETLYKQYASLALPLAEKPLAAAQLSHGLLAEMAVGYKSVIIATAGDPTAETTRNNLIASSLYAMHHLSRLLVDNYSLYAPEPKNLWLEMHQIYRFAEKQGFINATFQQGGKNNNVQSIGHTYRRIIMLALANPYHLMQGEALLVFRELDKWASTCRIIPLATGASPKGYLFLDLESDTPPRFASVRMNLAKIGDGRILDISGALPILEQRTKDLLVSSKTESGQLNLTGRKLRNMYKRLAETWGIRTERMSERRQRSTPVEVTVGISSCHHFASNGADFKPEISEIESRSKGLGGRRQGLSLTAESDAPWLKEDEAQRINAGIIQPRTSQFGTETTKDKDIWVKVYSTQAYFEHKKSSEVPSNQSYESTICQIRDESRGGMAISCRKAKGIRLIPGEIIGFKSEQAPSGNDWSIGVVRWLRTGEKDKLELGIRLLADDTLPVATRGIKGVGKDSEYFRSLLLPKMDPMQYPTTLITPAAVYDVESLILVNTGTHVFYAHLTRLIDATNAYSLFQYQIVDTP